MRSRCASYVVARPLNCGVMRQSDRSQFPTTAARQALAKRLGVPYSDDMQDWEWQVADATRFDEFLAAYDAPELSDGERYSLMEVLVQCIEDLSVKSSSHVAWAAVERRLRLRASLHRPTIEYWACVGATKPESVFNVSLLMRRLLKRGAQIASR